VKLPGSETPWRCTLLTVCPIDGQPYWRTTLLCTLLASHFFSCSQSNLKKSFYRAFNCILSKIGGVVDENVIMELVKTKCLPCLYFGLEACPVNKSVMNSLEFVLNGIIRKNFRTRSNELVKDCLMYFNCVAADNVFRRKFKFLNKIKQANNSLCRLFVAKMCVEITAMEQLCCQ